MTGHPLQARPSLYSLHGTILDVFSGCCQYHKMHQIFEPEFAITFWRAAHVVEIATWQRVKAESGGPTKPRVFYQRT